MHGLYEVDFFLQQCFLLSTVTSAWTLITWKRKEKVPSLINKQCQQSILFYVLNIPMHTIWPLNFSSKIFAFPYEEDMIFGWLIVNLSTNVPQPSSIILYLNWSSIFIVTDLMSNMNCYSTVMAEHTHAIFYHYDLISISLFSETQLNTNSCIAYCSLYSRLPKAIYLQKENRY